MAKAKAKKKEKADYKLIQKRSKRWAVLGKDGTYIHGEEKVKILIKEGKIKVEKPKKKKMEEPVEEVVAEEAPTEEAAAEEAPAEEAAAEEAPAEEAAEEKTEKKTVKKAKKKTEEKSEEKAE